THALLASCLLVISLTSVEGWRAHYWSLMTPIELPSPASLASRVPERAQADMIEWGPALTAEEQFRRMLDRELVLTQLTSPAPDVPTLSDDRPYNEYFFLRWYLAGLR